MVAIRSYQSTHSVLLLPVEVEAVSFSGSKYWELKSDDVLDSTDPKKTYSAPQWVDKDGNGDAADITNGEHNYAVAFTRNTKPTISAKFKIKGLPSGLSVKLSATGPDGFQWASDATVAGEEITSGTTEASTALVNTVKYYNKTDANKAFELKWKASFDGGSTWSQIAKTKHTVYVTLNDPTSSLRQETLFDIGCKNGDGQSDGGTAVDKIWAGFSGRDVRRVDNVQMKYWFPADSAVQDLPSMLAVGDGNGTCVAWSNLLNEVIREQGIPGSSIIQVLSSYQNDANISIDGGGTTRGLFLVKTWSFTGTVGAPTGCAPFTYLNDECKDEDGLPGQGNPNPPGAFFNHFIVKYNNKFYDPSYGGIIHSDQNTWENDSLDGFKKACQLSIGAPVIVGKKNDTGAVETVFQ